MLPWQEEEEEAYTKQTQMINGALRDKPSHHLEWSNPTYLP
jgi:hypothetical protein